jgi:hypothetical protein
MAASPSYDEENTKLRKHKASHSNYRKLWFMLGYLSFTAEDNNAREISVISLGT